MLRKTKTKNNNNKQTKNFNERPNNACSAGYVQPHIMVLHLNTSALCIKILIKKSKQTNKQMLQCISIARYLLEIKKNNNNRKRQQQQQCLLEIRQIIIVIILIIIINNIKNTTRFQLTFTYCHIHLTATCRIDIFA